ncbi:nitrous oxide reductase accessory protein NosL [Nitratiruptor tergarcus]|uniref:Nitrous oxide reductase accessory protein NosL n=1 Tax=Nitratiruptor tergarcus DSM 16512 TaxID=1069081 RepID=A0A1W1WTT6_9BACT|nr:nitrous oxide reductase accessory protein NosL [Nitratiruptor tergarcus]SMC09153.1 Nitrous oxide reductase accessory protein NosL [Nitratiruptor tergarcus DSM 16512]
MRKLLLPMFFVLALFAFNKSMLHPELHQKWCSVCGMNLAKFYKTNHLVVLKDGKQMQLCSMHCLAQVYPHIKDKIAKIMVVDAKSGKFIPVQNAYYVVGSSVPGTMSMQSKIAFSSIDDAKAFQKKYGGKIMRFDEAFALQRKMFAKEQAKIAHKQKKMAMMGKILYKKHCKKVDGEFASLAKLKEHIVKNHLCNLQGKKLQAVALYLWQKQHKKHIHVPKDAKCPVCGMFVAKHPRWATMIVDEEGRKLYFDGVKDMMKYLQNHKFKRAYVSDYYSGEAVDATKAYYVLGSDVYGPMGKELIPFKSLQDAKSFLNDHKGKKILRFSQINKEVLQELE